MGEVGNNISFFFFFLQKNDSQTKRNNSLPELFGISLCQNLVELYLLSYKDYICQDRILSLTKFSFKSKKKIYANKKIKSLIQITIKK